ncbi:Alpha beta hydrolase fold protein [Rutstroemia sp. NJR-2017a WRK4]|nr:Alpha beta hydrolase fold protein [Rutstroemia sp. NJR-2017a WRK4]
MASVQFPVRQCLTCAANGATCDGGFPVCSSCLSLSAPCDKPNIEVGVPWQKSPTSQSCEVSSHDPNHDDAVFTEEFVKAQHGELINGITQVYETLLRMEYIEASEIKRPPHQNLPKEELVTIGLEPEVIALLRYLPFLDIHDEISYGTIPYSYLDDVSEAREVLWEGEYDLAPWAVRLASCVATPGIFGRTIIYDIRTKRIIQWPNNSPGYTNTYLDLPSVPAKVMLDQWIEWLRDLKEVPWSEGSSRHVQSAPPAPPSGYIDYIANGLRIVDPTPDSDQYMLDSYNKGAAQKRLFVDHGWPDNFRVEEFRIAKQRFERELKKLKKLGMGVKNLVYSVPSDGHVEAIAEVKTKYSKFLEESAGSRAIIKNIR